MSQRFSLSRSNYWKNLSKDYSFFCHSYRHLKKKTYFLTSSFLSLANFSRTTFRMEKSFSNMRSSHDKDTRAIDPCYTITITSWPRACSIYASISFSQYRSSILSYSTIAGKGISFGVEPNLFTYINKLKSFSINFMKDLNIAQAGEQTIAILRFYRLRKYLLRIAKTKFTLFLVFFIPKVLKRIDISLDFFFAESPAIGSHFVQSK